MDTLFDALDDDWGRLAAAPSSTRRLVEWAEADAALSGFADLADLAARNGVATPVQADAVLGALAAAAREDTLAARVVLQLLLPGCRSVSRRLAWLVPDREEREALVVASAFTRIRTYPIAQRPRSIAANVLLDTAKAVRRAAEPAISTAALDEAAALPEAPADRPAAEELLELIATATRSGVIDAADAHAIAMTRVVGLSVEEVAVAQRRHPGSVRRSRRAAEARLALVAA